MLFKSTRKYIHCLAYSYFSFASKMNRSNQVKFTELKIIQTCDDFDPLRKRLHDAFLVRIQQSNLVSLERL